MNCVLLGKSQKVVWNSLNKNVEKIFDDVVLNSNKFKIIVDCSDIFEFSLDKLQNSSYWDVRNYLSCQQKTLSPFEVSFLVSEELFFLKFWKKKNFIIQKICCTNSEFFKNIDSENGIIPIELVVLDFCKKIEKITEKTWWIYIAKHDLSGYRIVAGCGNGIILSRSLDTKFLKHENLAKEIIDSLRFLRRFGLENDFKIITPLRGIKLGEQKINPINLKEVCNNLNLKITSDIEECLLNFFSTYKTRTEIFSKISPIKYFFKEYEEKIIKFLMAIIVFLIFYFWCISLGIKILRNEISDYKKQNNMILTNHDNNIELTVTNENFSFIFQFVEHLKKLKNPVFFIEKIAEFMDDQKLKSTYTEIENCNSIKLRTKLNEEQKQNLKKYNNENFKIEIDELQNLSKGEYEELKSKSQQEKSEMMICIKTK